MVMRSLLLYRYHGWTVMEHNHLSAAEVAGFIDRSLGDEVRAQAVEHLATCERCRDEVAACVRLASTVPAPKHTSGAWRTLAAVAAVLVLGVALRSNWRQPAVRGEREVPSERSASATTRIRTVFPTDTVPIARSQLRFVWRRDAQATTYALAVDDSSGRSVWAGEISDTTFTLPDSARVAPSGLYFWHVDAIHVDGSSAQSDAIAFRIAP